MSDPTLNNGPFTVCGPDHPGRVAAEAFTAGHYQRHFGASLTSFFPQLLTINARRGGLRACLGYRDAATGPLFLEQYLQRPVEQIVSERLGMSLPRKAIVEVGGLAAAWPGAGRRLILGSAGWLHRAGFEVVVFTATRCLANSFQRLNLSPVELAPADPACLREGPDVWGDYYVHAPRVYGGVIASAVPGRASSGRPRALGAWR